MFIVDLSSILLFRINLITVCIFIYFYILDIFLVKNSTMTPFVFFWTHFPFRVVKNLSFYVVVFLKLRGIQLDI